MMLALPELKVFVALGTTDLRKSINGLSILVDQHFELDPFTGNLFAFCNRRRNLAKVLYWDRNGFCLWQKRLERNKFRWPSSEEEVMEIGGRELMWLLDGLELSPKGAHARLHYDTIF